MSAGEERGRVPRDRGEQASAPRPLSPGDERRLAQQAAVAALTAVGRIRGSAAEAAAGGRTGAGSRAGASGQGYGASGSGYGASGAGTSGSGGTVRHGFASPARAIRRQVRGTWRSRT